MPGTEIKITVQRDGKMLDFAATLDEFDNRTDKSPGTDKGTDENSPGGKDQGGKLGLSLQPVTPQVARQLGLESDSEGLVVTEVDPGGASAEAGIARGDVILEINRKPVNTVADVKSVLDAGGNKPLLLLISRRGQTIYLTVQAN